MTGKKNSMIYSGAGPEEVARDILPLVDFQEEGISLDTLTRLIEERLVPHFMEYDHPAFLSMFNFFPENAAKLGAETALAYNQGVTNWQVSPGGAVLEELCCRALCRLFGFIPESDATFMYSGTYANQEAVYLALHRRAEDQGFDLNHSGLNGFKHPEKLRVLASRDAHFSMKQAVRILGLGEESLISIKTDDNHRVDIDHFQKTIEQRKPDCDIFAAAATAGTTSTGSVDPIASMARICRENRIWLHVDGAYGLAYALIPELKTLFRGMEEADSVSWDPHKQFGIPIPNSILFTRKGSDLKRLAVYGEYFNRPDDTEPNPGLKSPPSTRPLSALPLAASIRHLGLKKITDRLRAPLSAVREVYLKIQDCPDVETGHKPDTGILCFRIVPGGISPDKINPLQKFLYKAIMEGAERTLSITRLDGKDFLRLVALSPDVRAAHLWDTVNCARTLAAERIHAG